jgi:outer membrane protein insertion porin family
MMKWVRKVWPALVLIFWFVMAQSGSVKAESQKIKGNDEPTISHIVIDVQGIKGDANRWGNLVKKLIFLEQDEPFSVEKFQNSLQALKSSNLFKAVHVSENVDKQGRLSLYFYVTPYPQVKDIKIYGAFPLLEREILNAMQLRSGDVHRPERLLDRADAIVRLYKKEGFIDPKVHMIALKDPSDGDFVINVHIDKGDFFHVRRIDITGNRAFSKLRLRLRIGTWKLLPLPASLKRFKEEEFAKDIRKLIQFYRQKGYPDVGVDSVSKKDMNTHTVSIYITINEGPRYRIGFVGNTAFYSWTLKKDLVLFKEGNQRDIGLRKSIRKIKARYLDAGYRDCRIKMTSEVKQEKENRIRQIRMIIDEGPEYIVNAVNIAGNVAIDTETIKKQILSRSPEFFNKGAFVLNTLEEDAQAIISLYVKQGYMAPVVDSRLRINEVIKDNKKRVNIVFDIKEGVQTRVTSVKFPGLNVLSKSEILDAVALKKGSVFRSHMIESDENEVSSLISEKGYPLVKVKGTVNISDDKTGADLTFKVNEGRFVKMGHVASTGNFLTKERVITDELELQPGESFSLIRLLESQRTIRNINAFESVDFRTFGLKEEADAVNLLVEVEEKKPYYAQFSTGYDTERKLYGNILAGDQNLFGLNKDVWGRAEISQIGYRGDLGISEPRFLTTRIRSTVNLFGEEREEFNKEFGTRNKGFSVSFYHEFFRNLKAIFSFVYNYREQYLRVPGPIPVGEEEKYEPRSILVTQPSLIYNSMDSYIRPRNGIYSALSVDISKGIQNSLDDFLKYRFEIRKYITPVENMTFALRGRVGHITPFEEASTIPEDQLFFLGGTADVRGFDENRLRFNDAGEAVGGRTEVLGNIESRFALGPDFEFSLFYTMGSIRNALVDEGSDEFRSSAGIGLHYFTPVGPVGVYYGHKIDRKEQESSGEFHFTIGFRF